MTATLIFQLTDEDDDLERTDASSPVSSDWREDDRAGAEDDNADHVADAGGSSFTDSLDDQTGVLDPVPVQAPGFHYSSGSNDGGWADEGLPRDLRRGALRRGRKGRFVAVGAILGAALLLLAIVHGARDTGRSFAAQRPVVAAAASAAGVAQLPASAASPRRGRWPTSPGSPAAPASQPQTKPRSRPTPRRRAAHRQRPAARGRVVRDLLTSDAAATVAQAAPVPPSPPPGIPDAAQSSQTTQAPAGSTGVSGRPAEFSFER